jgi:transposase InsO family protein
MSKSGCQVKTRTLCINQCAKGFLEIHILLQTLTVFGKMILRTYVPCRDTIINTNTSNVIDVFSRYAWSVPLKDETGMSIAAALTTLFKIESPLPYNQIQVQFVNATVQQYLKRQGVDFHTAHNPDIKWAVTERFNRTLKTKMYKYFTKNNTYRYFDVLNNLLASYNNSVHSTIAMPPSKVSPSNIYSVW